MGAGASVLPDKISYGAAQNLLGDKFTKEDFYGLCTSRSDPPTITKEQFSFLVRHKNGKALYWEYVDTATTNEYGWKPFSAEKMVRIEMGFNDKARSTEILGEGGSEASIIDFETMTITNQLNAQTLPVRRKEVRWEYENKCVEWVAYDAESSQVLEDVQVT